MAWRRNFQQYKETTKTTVHVHWNTLVPVYDVTFSNTYHFDEMMILTAWIKKIPAHEKDISVQQINGKNLWTYSFIEKYAEPFCMMINLMDNFVLDFVEKPAADSSYIQHFTPTSELLERFKTITSDDITNLDYTEGKRVYRRACLRLHPDKGGSAELMSQLNSTWTALEVQHYKTREKVEQLT